MASFTSFLTELPERSLELFQNHFESAKICKREVTLLLSLITTGFCIPLKLLQEEDGPSGHANSSQQSMFSCKAGKAFVNSVFMPHSGTISAGQSAEFQWSEKLQNEVIDATSFPKDWPSGRVFSVIRNGLAHGSVLTLGDPQIEKIVFLSIAEYKGQKIGLRFVSVTPDALRSLFEQWVEWLKGNFSVKKLNPVGYHGTTDKDCQTTASEAQVQLGE